MLRYRNLLIAALVQEANLHWSVLSVQVPECKARGAGGMLPQENIFEFDAAS